MKIPFSHFKQIIELYQKIQGQVDDFYKIKFDITATVMWETWEKLFDVTLSICFGPVATEAIWQFILHDNSPFETIEELYDFVSDAYVEHVNQNNPLSLEQLVKLFPKEPMFELFQKAINEYKHANNHTN